jgi:hypothetical protein
MVSINGTGSPLGEARLEPGSWLTVPKKKKKKYVKGMRSNLANETRSNVKPPYFTRTNAEGRAGPGYIWAAAVGRPH